MRAKCVAPFEVMRYRTLRRYRQAFGNRPYRRLHRPMQAGVLLSEFFRRSSSTSDAVLA
jgi:hypothetical protein